jgi:hypothetical protein
MIDDGVGEQLWTLSSELRRVSDELPGRNVMRTEERAEM